MWSYFPLLITILAMVFWTRWSFLKFDSCEVRFAQWCAGDSQAICLHLLCQQWPVLGWICELRQVGLWTFTCLQSLSKHSWSHICSTHSLQFDCIVDYFFRQSPWSCLCCIRLSKFVIITLHYITRVVHLRPSDMTVISDCCVYCIHCIFGKIGLHCYFHSGCNNSPLTGNLKHLKMFATCQ